MIIALAGRRIDAPNADIKRFPAENAERVQKQIRDFMTTVKATTLVSAAACGADLLALEAAGELGLVRRIVLPFDIDTFRRTSVTDRGGDWEKRYDRILAEVQESGHLEIGDYAPDDEDGYFAANHDILDNAEEIALEQGDEILVLIVWNGESRGEDDVTAHFLEQARRRGLRTAEIKTV